MLARARDLEALAYSLATCAGGVKPQVHFGTPRPEMRSLPGSARIEAPTLTEQSDFVRPFELMAFALLAEGLAPFDTMLEAKARDLAPLGLCEDLERFAPELARQAR